MNPSREQARHHRELITEIRHWAPAAIARDLDKLDAFLLLCEDELPNEREFFKRRDFPAHGDNFTTLGKL